ncbi:hypothetical protein V8C35DRAFT_69569 [Trichoderma chlorosporum]
MGFLHSHRPLPSQGRRGDPPSSFCWGPPPGSETFFSFFELVRIREPPPLSLGRVPAALRSLLSPRDLRKALKLCFFAYARAGAKLPGLPTDVCLNGGVCVCVCGGRRMSLAGLLSRKTDSLASEISRRPRSLFFPTEASQKQPSMMPRFFFFRFLSATRARSLPLSLFSFRGCFFGGLCRCDFMLKRRFPCGKCFDVLLLPLFPLLSLLTQTCWAFIALAFGRLLRMRYWVDCL